MKLAFLIIVLLHGLIHSLGFVKAFGFAEVKELTLPISKQMGILWLVATVLYLVYCLFYFINHKDAWLIGLIALVLSQILIICFWTDAKIGSVPNLFILIMLVISYGNFRFEALVEKEQADILIRSKIPNSEIFYETKVGDLPQPVKKWLLSCGALGKPKTLNGVIKQKASMKMKPEQDDWYSATAIQYTVINEPAFIWAVNLKVNNLMYFKGRDKFQDGKGEMLIKMNSLVNVVNEAGEKIDEGSLQRFLGEMVWFPSLAVSPYVKWEEISELSAKATMKYKRVQGSGTFYFSEKGDFVKFIALRYQGNEADSERKEWILTVDDYNIFEGIKVPSKMKATWKLENGNWTWLKLEILDIQYNINVQSQASGM